MAFNLPIYSRACGDCTKCCEGWLTGRVHGHKMQRGCNCFYLEKTCQIYESRPDDPCKKYNCAWLLEDQFPSWLKPSLSKVIITKRSMMIPGQDGLKKVDYYDAIEAGDKIDSSVLNWLILWAIEKNLNFVYEVEGQVYGLGEKQFKESLGI